MHARFLVCPANIDHILQNTLTYQNFLSGPPTWLSDVCSQGLQFAALYSLGGNPRVDNSGGLHSVGSKNFLDDSKRSLPLLSAPLPHRTVSVRLDIKIRIRDFLSRSDPDPDRNNCTGSGSWSDPDLQENLYISKKHRILNTRAGQS